ncbi:PEP-CTERM sorting domain-containing protein [Paludisphaera soli]|uniref:PEP-CTERM sorting domain-containing protein n=1 Tax=Paludisphaera soli TaxID=2712865 RepID=UPI0013EBDD81|nr:PEP-CTERM sorting domain-containing protein [Paludisphaera soli]
MRLIGASALALGFLACFPVGAARADLFLTLEPSSAVVDVGDVIVVDVLLSQDGTGPQVDALNPLFSAGVRVSFGDPAGILGVDLGSIAYLLDWVADADFDGPSAITIGLTSLTGFDDLSTPLLLARLTFTGLAAGTTVVSVADLDPQSPDFATLNGDVLDPANVATARITVRPADVAVPEPSSLAMGLLAVAAASAVARRGRPVVVAG